MEEIFVPALGVAMCVAWRLTAILNVDHRVWDGLDAAELLSDFDHRISAYGRYDDDD